MCDRMAVMYAGKIGEHGAVRDLFRSPKHPMPKLGSKELLYAIPGAPPISPNLPRAAPSTRDAPMPCRSA